MHLSVQVCHCHSLVNEILVDMSKYVKCKIMNFLLQV